jgi:microcompartment protein CcmL/EutN
MDKAALGILEFNSIAQGIFAADQALKKASIQLLIARAICPGKYLVVINGEISEVKSSVMESESAGDYHNIDSIVIPNLHLQIPHALTGTTDIKSLLSLGIVETFSAPTAIQSADRAVKTANVELIEIRIANGIGGKSFYTVTGKESEVRSAIDAGVELIKDTGLLMNWTVIPSPDADLYYHLL